jgi:hypothetical protein
VKRIDKSDGSQVMGKHQYDIVEVKDSNGKALFPKQKSSDAGRSMSPRALRML